MPKYLIRYESREYYEKEYEADSLDNAIAAYYDDDRLFGKPYDSDTNIVEIETESGVVIY